MRYFVCLASMFLVLACTSVVMAAPVSGDLTKPTDPTLPDWFSATGGGVDIPGGTGGVGIYLDPKAGPWIKQIVGISVSPLPITEGPIFIVADPNSNPPGPAWTDWDELIMTPGWHWANNASLTITEADGITQKNVAGIVKTVNFANDWVEFDFNPAENPGAILNPVTKNLVYNGPGQPVNQQVFIAEYPTPEPGTIALLATGLLALGLGRIWRRN